MAAAQKTPWEQFEKSLDKFSIRVRAVSIGATHAGFSLVSFGSQLMHGSPIIGAFVNTLQQAETAVQKYLVESFEKASQSEVSRLGSGQNIASALKLNFDDGLELFDKAKVSLAKSAAIYTGTTDEYISLYKFVSDDMSSALAATSLTGDELKRGFEQIVPEAVKNLFLNAKTYGQDIALGSIARSYSAFLATGDIKEKEIFFLRNQMLTNALKEWEKKTGKKWSNIGKAERFLESNKIIAHTFTAEQIKRMNQTFDSKWQGFVSSMFDPNTGMFGFERKFKSKKTGEETDFFQIISAPLKNLLDALTQAGGWFISMFDPLQGLGNLIETHVTPKVFEFALNLQAFATDWGTMFQDMPLVEKLGKLTEAIFGVDIVNFDYSEVVKNFFEWLVGVIKGFGKNVGVPSELDQVMSELVTGIFNVIGAVIDKLGEMFMANPGQFIKIAFLLNPGAVLAGFGALFAMLSFFVAVLQLAVSVVGLFNASLGALLSFPLIFVTALVALAAVVIIFSDWFTKVGKDLSELGQYLTDVGNVWSAFIILLGESFTYFGKAGQAFKDAFGLFMQGKWQEGLLKLWDFLRYFISGLFTAAVASIIGIITLIVEGIGLAVNSLGDVLKNLGEWAGSGISKWWTDATGEWGKGWDSMVSSLGKAVTNTWKSWTSDITTSVIEVQKAFGAVVDWVKSVVPNFGAGSTAPATNLGPNSAPVMPAGTSVFNGPTAAGNPMGQLFGVLARERLLAPSGSVPVIANSSETIMNRSDSSAVMAALAGGGGSTMPITFNIYQSGNEDITGQIMRALENAFAIV